MFFPAVFLLKYFYEEVERDTDNDVPAVGFRAGNGTVFHLHEDRSAIG